MCSMYELIVTYGLSSYYGSGSLLKTIYTSSSLEVLKLTPSIVVVEDVYDKV
jgi:hypothetical protein